MTNAEATLAALANTVENEIRTSQRQLRDFSILTFVARIDLDQRERTRLLEWAELLLANHLEGGAIVTSWHAQSACLALLPGIDSGDANRIGQTYAEQLNKLPVGGVAPGRAWTWHCLNWAEQSGPVRELAAKAREARGYP